MVDKSDSVSTDKPTSAGKPASTGKPAFAGKPTFAGKPDPLGAVTGQPDPADKPALTTKPSVADKLASPKQIGLDADKGGSGSPDVNKGGLASLGASQDKPVSPNTDKSGPPRTNPAEDAPKKVPVKPDPGSSGGAGTVKLEKPNKRFLLSLGGIVLSLLVLFALANYVVPRVLVSLTRAARTGDYSPANSYVFASPITAKADGQQKVQVNVFLLDTEGHGVSGQPIGVNMKTLGNAAGVPQVRQVQPTTNKNGQAAFEVTSAFSGQFEIIANVGGIDLPQTVSVVFK